MIATFFFIPLTDKNVGLQKMIFFFFLTFFFLLCMYQNTKIKTVNFKKDNLNVLNICKTKVKKKEPLSQMVNEHQGLGQVYRVELHKADF